MVTVAFMLWKGGDEHLKDRPEKDIKLVSEKLKKELKLSDVQFEQMIQLRSYFFEQEKKLKQTIRSQRDSMNAEMFHENSDINHVKEIARRVAENEYQMELYRIEQAIELKKICSQDQIQKFEYLVKDIRDYFKPVNKTP